MVKKEYYKKCFEIQTYPASLVPLVRRNVLLWCGCIQKKYKD